MLQPVTDVAPNVGKTRSGGFGKTATGILVELIKTKNLAVDWTQANNLANLSLSIPD